MKPCPSFPGYSITESGQVFTHRRRLGNGRGHGSRVEIDPLFTKGLRPHIGHGGYVYVSIATDRGQRAVPIHVLLADAYLGPRPDGMEVRHLDGNPQNNALSNLVYGTVKENAEDRILHGTQPRGVDHARAILNDAEVRSIRRCYAKGDTIAEIARRIGVGESTVRDVIKGRRWTHVH